MENNPADSSESDLSDAWSVISKDSVEPSDIPVDSSVSSSESDLSDAWSVLCKGSVERSDIPADSSVIDGNSNSGEPSDGESCEVIDEEEKDHDECK
jgi:hypothetical protein